MPIDARYRSTCPTCGQPIEVGDVIDRNPDSEGYVHAACLPEPKPRFTVELADIKPGQATWIEGPDAEDDVIAAWVPEGSVEVVTISARPEPERDHLGRYRLPDPTGKVKGHSRVTTVCKAIDRQDALIAWKERQVAAGIGAREDLYALVASHRDPDTADRKLYTEIVEQAHEAAGSNARSRKGTALHRFCEEVDLGRMGIEQVPSIWRGQVMRYGQCLEANGIRVDLDHVEQIFIDDRHGIAGTGDRVLWLPDRRLPVIADIKTGSIQWNRKAICCQLAIYQDHTATFDVRTGRRGPRLQLDPRVGIIIHLPQDGDTCTLYQVDLGTGREYYQVALEVREIQRQKEDEVVAYYRPANVAQPYDWIAGRLWALVALNEQITSWLSSNWPTGVRLPFPADPTGAEIDAIDAFLRPIEDELGAPFSIGVAP